MTWLYVHTSVFFFNDTATTEIYTLSLHDALPIFPPGAAPPPSGAEPSRSTPLDVPLLPGHRFEEASERDDGAIPVDRKSTRLNSSHANISYAVFCLKKKKKKHLEVIDTHSLLYIL